VDQVTFEAFEASARAEGFDEVVERRWAARTVLEPHTHPFALRVRVIQGEMWLIVGDDVRHLFPGDTFTLDSEVPHAERYGEEGATYWVARRTPGRQ
jgi:quercetin dioxygenase-like cupin family protein